MRRGPDRGAELGFFEIGAHTLRDHLLGRPYKAKYPHLTPLDLATSEGAVARSAAKDVVS